MFYKNSGSHTEPDLDVSIYMGQLYWWLVYNYFKELIIVPILFIVLAGIWLRTFPFFLVINRNLKAEWENLPEFAITNHAQYAIKKYFVPTMISILVLIPFAVYYCFRSPDFSFLDKILLIPISIICVVFIYITAIFSQSYQILVVIFIFEQCLKLKFARKQSATKTIIRTLYKCCIIRDFVINPVIALFSIGWLSELLPVGANASLKTQLTYSRVFELISNDSIFFVVPLTVLYYFYRRRNLNNKENLRNPLQDYIFKQAMVIAVIKAIIFTIFFILFLLDNRLSWFMIASRMDLMVVVVAVQISAIICFRKRLIAYRRSQQQEVFATNLPPIIIVPPPNC